MEFFFQKSIKPYIFRILITSTSQKLIYNSKKGFDKNFSKKYENMEKNQKKIFFQKFNEPYTFRILITSTSQKTYIQLEKGFRQKFLEKI